MLGTGASPDRTSGAAGGACGDEGDDPPMESWPVWWFVRTYLQSLGQVPLPPSPSHLVCSLLFLSRSHSPTSHARTPLPYPPLFLPPPRSVSVKGFLSCPPIAPEISLSLNSPILLLSPSRSSPSVFLTLSLGPSIGHTALVAGKHG